tara:strand:- start:2 stop:229 length:228 start_codon:yes stop_codon:yes gene_type:complete
MTYYYLIEADGVMTKDDLRYSMKQLLQDQTQYDKDKLKITSKVLTECVNQFIEDECFRATPEQIKKFKEEQRHDL